MTETETCGDRSHITLRRHSTLQEVKTKEIVIPDENFVHSLCKSGNIDYNTLLCNITATTYRDVCEIYAVLSSSLSLSLLLLLSSVFSAVLFQ